MMVTANKQCLTPSKSSRPLLSPTKRHRPATVTPKKRINNNGVGVGNNPSIALSPPPLLRTPPKTTSPRRLNNGNNNENNLGGGAATTPKQRRHKFASHYSSDRFIPNRSALRVDICRASVESAERNLGRTFEKLSRHRNDLRRRRGELGENGDPNRGGSSSSSSASSDSGSGSGGGAAPPPLLRSPRSRIRTSARAPRATMPPRPSRRNSIGG